MTTIVATRTAIYADSNVGAYIPFGTNKLHRITHEASGDEYLMGGAGELEELEFFARLLAHHGLNDMWKLHFNEHWPPKIMKHGKWDTDVLVVTRSKQIYLMSDGLVPMVINESHYSIGSGSDWALAAMDHGKTCEEAVEYACTRDSDSKLPVHKLNFARKS